MLHGQRRFYVLTRNVTKWPRVDMYKEDGCVVIYTYTFSDDMIISRHHDDGHSRSVLGREMKDAKIQEQIDTYI